jgi:hypothetical protein
MSNANLIVNEYTIPSDRTEVEFYVHDGAQPVGVGWKNNTYAGLLGAGGWHTILLLESLDMPQSKQRWFIVKTGEPFENPGVMRHLGSIDQGRSHVFHHIRQ